MKLTEDVYLIGSGSEGVNITNDFDCNVYLIDGKDELAVIDAGAGMGTDEIIANVIQHGFSPDKISYLILTHAHADHAGGAKKFVDQTGAKVIASPLCADYLERADEEAISLAGAKRAGFYPMDYQFEACPVARKVNDGDEIKVGKHVLKVIDTPGHSNGHICIYMQTDERNYLFSGDLVFFGGKVSIQHIYDCNVFEIGNSIKRLQDFKIDSLLPSHETFVLKNGSRHVHQAIKNLERLVIPPSVIY